MHHKTIYLKILSVEKPNELATVTCALIRSFTTASKTLTNQQEMMKVWRSKMNCQRSHLIYQLETIVIMMGINRRGISLSQLKTQH
jgi:hypothetical protein